MRTGTERCIRRFLLTRKPQGAVNFASRTGPLAGTILPLAPPSASVPAPVLRSGRMQPRSAGGNYLLDFNKVQLKLGAASLFLVFLSWLNPLDIFSYISLKPFYV